MKRLFILTLICAALSGCASMQARKGQSEETAAKEVKFLRMRDGRMLTVRQGEKYPKVIVTPSGQHALMMRPTGNLAVVVNPDGTHSTAMINDSTATIVTP